MRAEALFQQIQDRGLDLRPCVRARIDQIEMPCTRYFDQPRIVARGGRGSLEAAAKFDRNYIVRGSVQQPLRYAQRQQFDGGRLVVARGLFLGCGAEQLRHHAAAQTQFPGAAQIGDSGE